MGDAVRIVFSKAAGGVPVLTCFRDDGSSTYSKSAHGAFFGPHDLMHYAVESVLGLEESFFGLIARGWAVEDFARPGAAARLPPEALHTEMMVGQLVSEHAFGPPLDAAAFNATIAASLAAAGARRGRAPLPPAGPLGDDDLRRIRDRFADLLARYNSLKDGERLELRFPAD